MVAAEEVNAQVKIVDAVKIFFTDLNGRLMSLPVNPDHMAQIITDGIGFDGSSVAGYASVDKSDRILVPDPATFQKVSFEDETLGFYIGCIRNDRGERAQADPRALLERVIAEAATEYGIKFKVGPEHEFFLLVGDDFSAKTHSDQAGYFLTSPHDKGETVRNRIIRILKSCGIAFEKSHHEVTPSQHEINLECADPLAAADRTVLFNYVTKKVAQEFGYHATFMPKPFSGFNRSAFHIHISMQDMDGNNLFYGGEGEDQRLSLRARQFIGGILRYGREVSVVMASTINSYKAYVLEREAPIIRGWGFSNRSSMVRVPFTSNPSSTRIELRSPDPAGNMYLQIATLIGMGLQGIRDDEDCGTPDLGSTYARRYKPRMWDKRFLPKSLFEALVEAERSRFLKDFLGERIYDSYMQLKRAEWEAYRTHVTQWDLDKYLYI